MTEQERVGLEVEAIRNVDLYDRNRYRRGARGQIRGNALLRALAIYTRLMGAERRGLIAPGIEVSPLVRL